jgi:TRAP-type C4-dicarboxylate transport system permease small subunit
MDRRSLQRRRVQRRSEQQRSVQRRVAIPTALLVLAACAFIGVGQYGVADKSARAASPASAVAPPVPQPSPHVVSAPPQWTVVGTTMSGEFAHTHFA